MSYILDALKRAEQERGAGEISAQAHKTGDAPAAVNRRWPLYATGATLVVVALVVGLAFNAFNQVEEPAVADIGALNPQPAVVPIDATQAGPIVSTAGVEVSPIINPSDPQPGVTAVTRDSQPESQLKTTPTKPQQVVVSPPEPANSQDLMIATDVVDPLPTLIKNASLTGDNQTETSTEPSSSTIGETAIAAPTSVKESDLPAAPRSQSALTSDGVTTESEPGATTASVASSNGLGASLSKAVSTEIVPSPELGMATATVAAENAFPSTSAEREIAPETAPDATRSPPTTSMEVPPSTVLQIGAKTPPSQSQSQPQPIVAQQDIAAPSRPATGTAEKLLREGGQVFSGKVIAIRSGCEIEINVGGFTHRVSLSEVTCPQPNDDLARDARRFSTRMVFTRQVRLIAHERLGALEFRGAVLDESDQVLNEALVSAGLAWSAAPRYHAAEQRARQQKMGMWKGLQ